MTRTIVCKHFYVPLGDERVAEPSDLKASDNNLSSFFTKRNLGCRIVSEAWCSPKNFITTHSRALYEHFSVSMSNKELYT